MEIQNLGEIRCEMIYEVLQWLQMDRFLGFITIGKIALLLWDIWS